MTKTILTATALLVAIDIIGFLFWVASGQLPVDSFYVGTITGHILSEFLF